MYVTFYIIALFGLTSFVHEFNFTSYMLHFVKHFIIFLYQMGLHYNAYIIWMTGRVYDIVILYFLLTTWTAVNTCIFVQIFQGVVVFFLIKILYKQYAKGDCKPEAFPHLVLYDNLHWTKYYALKRHLSSWHFLIQ